jgi:hypothetical protein
LLLFLALPKPMTLYEICRVAIRRILRRNIQIEHPAATGTVSKRRSQSRRGYRAEKRRRINLVPMQAGLMIVGQFPASDSDDDDDAEHGNGNAHDDDDDDEDENSRHSPTNGFRVFDEDDGGASDEEASERPSGVSVGRMLDSDSFLRRLFWPSRGVVEARNALAEELGLEVSENNGERETLNENVVAHADDEAAAAVDEAIDDGASDTHETPSQATSEAIVIDKNDIRSCKGSSGYGYSASYSSGIGTCSSLGAESESGNVDSTDDFFRPGTSAPRDGVFDDDSLDFDKSAASSNGVTRAVGRSRSLCEDPSVEKMEDIAEVQEEVAGGGVVAAAEPFVAVEDSGSTRVSFKRLMHEKVDMLPIPCALKEYLLYYRQL